MDERTTKRRGPLLWLASRSQRFWIVAAVLLPVATYVGSYAVMVEPMPVRHCGLYPNGKAMAIAPRYHATVAQDFWQWIFEPANSIDRRLRPKTWSVD